MTPKEKCDELIDKFYKRDCEIEKYNNFKTTNKDAKQCALIAINEILHYSRAHGFIELTKFHEEVKQEIEKL